MNEPAAKPKLDCWGVVEIFGHTRLAGRLQEEERLGSVMLRIDVPDANGETLHTRWFGHAAIFSISPTTREVAILVAQQCGSAAPVKPWELRAPAVHAIEAEADEHPESYQE